MATSSPLVTTNVKLKRKKTDLFVILSLSLDRVSIDFVYLNRDRETKGGTGSDLTCSSIPLAPAGSGDGSGWGWELGTQSTSPIWVAENQLSKHHRCVPGYALAKKLESGTGARNWILHSSRGCKWPHWHRSHEAKCPPCRLILHPAILFVDTCEFSPNIQVICK